MSDSESIKNVLVKIEGPFFDNLIFLAECNPMLNAVNLGNEQDENLSCPKRPLNFKVYTAFIVRVRNQN